MAEFVVRPTPKDVSSHSIFLAAQTMVLHSLQSGELVTIEKQDGKPLAAVVEKATDSNIKPYIVQMSKQLQDLYQLKLGDRITLGSAGAEIPAVTSVTVVEAVPGSIKDDNSRNLWTQLLALHLLGVGLIRPGLKLAETKFKLESVHGLYQEKLAFEILAVNDCRDDDIFRVETRPVVSFAPTDAPIVQVNRGISNYNVGGLEGQVRSLNRILSARNWNIRQLRGRPKLGVLLHGCSGTGKSLLLDQIAQTCKSFRIDKGVTRKKLQQTFSDALRSQPSMICIHDLAEIAPAKRDGPNSPDVNLVSVLQEGFRNIRMANVVVLGACRTPLEIDQDLRNFQYFVTEIEIPIPDANARSQILKIELALPKAEPSDMIDSIARRTHGFVGGDLVKLICEAEDEREARVEALEGEVFASFSNSRATSDLASSFAATQWDLTEEWELTEDDFVNAMRRVRPSALNEVFVETPHVTWSDIAGQEQVKQYLEQAIIWPYKYAYKLERYRIESSRGLLLYGPPGCSKTMIARAAATESGLNFIAVRGAELLNMYVGETERAIRNLFAKARSASPCIIFFDEMEAIASSRARPDGENSGVHAVTTLLNELDGVTDERGVFVLGATNQPQNIDPAILRPGRLDRMLYVGPPDVEARRSLLRKCCYNMPLGNVSLKDIAQKCDGFSGAEVVELCKTAAGLAFKEDIRTGQEQEVVQEHFEEALVEVPKTITPQMLDGYKAFTVSVSASEAKKPNGI